MSNKKGLTIVLFVLMALALSSCYFNETVQTDEVGIHSNGGNLEYCVTPGVYTAGGFFTDLLHVSRNTVTFSVEDPEVATQDNQFIGLRITVQARRMEACDEIKGLLTNWAHLVDDARLIETVTANARESIKVGTRGFTLPELLDDRNGLSTAITDNLEVDTLKYHVDIINVTVENIDPADDFTAALQEKALNNAKIEAAKSRQELIRTEQENNRIDQEQRQIVLEEQLKAEQRQTDVQVEIASREGEVVAAQNAIYYDNERAYELRRLELLRGIVGQGTVYFLPQDTDLTMLFNPQAQNVVPVPVEPPTNP